MASTSPTKRRALAPLDTNALSSPKPSPNKLSPSKTSPSKLSWSAPTTALNLPKPGQSPLRKRAVEASASAVEAANMNMTTVSPRPEKRVCVEQDRSRSLTPEDDSSLFDNDASWASNTTPDVSPAPRILTREQAREKAEILRLRLGLANYKLRTGQTDLPLANLVAKPLPKTTTSRPTSTYTEPTNTTTNAATAESTSQDPDAEHPKEESSSQDTQEEQDKEQTSTEQEQEQEEDEEAQELPRLHKDDTKPSVEGDNATPRRKEMLRVEDDERLTSSALRGGAASGLLSLARGGSEE